MDVYEKALLKAQHDRTRLTDSSKAVITARRRLQKAKEALSEFLKEEARLKTHFNDCQFIKDPVKRQHEERCLAKRIMNIQAHTQFEKDKVKAADLDYKAVERENAKIMLQTLNAELEVPRLIALQKQRAEEKLQKARKAGAKVKRNRERVTECNKKMIADSMEAQQDERNRMKTKFEIAKVLNKCAKERYNSNKRVEEEAEKMYTRLEKEEHDRKTKMLVHLKKTIVLVQEDMRRKDEIKRKKLEIKQEKRSEEYLTIMRAGGNPEAVFRARDEQQRIDREVKRIKKKIDERTNAITMKLGKQNLIATKQMSIKNKLKIAMEAYQRSMGPVFREKKIEQYMGAATVGAKQIIDPTGRIGKLYPNQFVKVKRKRFGLGQSSQHAIDHIQKKYPSAKPFEDYTNLPRSVKFENTRLSTARSALPSSSAKQSITEENVLKDQSSRESKDSKGNVNQAPNDVDTESATKIKSVLPAYSNKTTLRTTLVPGRSIPLIRPNTIVSFQKKHDRTNAFPLANTDVVCGKEYPGKKFLPSPTVVIFKDFTVGDSSQQTLTLTNTSFTFNSFKISKEEFELEHQDFNINYPHPGTMSAGVSASISITFNPSQNQDCKIELPIETENGLPFTVPIECYVKKAQVVLSSTVVDFCNVVQGETTTRSIIIKNQGALAVMYEINPIDSHFELPKFLTFKRKGRIGGYSKRNLTCMYSPVLVDTLNIPLKISLVLESTESFDTSNLDDNNWGSAKEFEIFFKGECIPVPIYVKEKYVDLQCCLFNTYYRKLVRVYNQSKSALQINMITPTSLRKHLNIIPDFCYVQGRAHFDITLEFTPDDKLQLNNDHAIEDTVTILIKGKKVPETFDMKAIVYDPTLTFDPPNRILDFGPVLIGYHKTKQITVTNNTPLLHKLGVYELEHRLRIRPADGFEALMPFESKTFDVDYIPEIEFAEKLSFEFTSSLNAETYKIHCRGSGKRSPIWLSQDRVNLPQTQIGDISETSIIIKNTSDKHHRFEFMTGFCKRWITVQPIVGSVAPDETMRLVVQFSPCDIKMMKPITPKDDKSGDNADDVESGDNAAIEEPTEPIYIDNPDIIEELKKGEETGLMKQTSLEDEANSVKRSFLLPLAIKEGDAIRIEDLVNDVTFEQAYLEINTLEVRRTFEMDKELSFGVCMVSIPTVNTVKLINNGEERVEIVQDPVFGYFSPFQIESFPEAVEAGQEAEIKIKFHPQASRNFREKLTILTSTGYTLTCKLSAKAYTPECEIEPSSLDFGDILANNKKEATFVVKNNAEVAVALDIRDLWVLGDGPSPFEIEQRTAQIEPKEEVEVKVSLQLGGTCDAALKVDLGLPRPKANRAKMLIQARTWSRQAYIRGFTIDPHTGEEVVRLKEASGKLIVGCAEITSEKFKGSDVDFKVEVEGQGFSCEEAKGKVKQGESTIVNFQFEKSSLPEGKEPEEGTATLTLTNGWSENKEKSFVKRIPLRVF